MLGVTRHIVAGRGFAASMTVLDALNSALDEEMSADPKVSLMGEEVGEYQGAYKISKGLLDKYGPDRVCDTPINEAMDHIINSAAKSNYMSAGMISVPVVFRGPNGAAAGVGAQHSRLCYINDGGPERRDADELPCMAVSFKSLTWGKATAEALDSSFCLPIGKAKIEHEGKDVTITAFSKMAGYALEAAEILEKDGISAEVINLRSIRPLDRTTINTYVRKTNRLVSVEEGFAQHGVGAEICASVGEESFEYLDAPVESISGADVPTPYAPNIERMAFPQVEDIVRATKRACYR
ncbi:hypothetical protein RJ639_000250 [Escallonia herrerae]|uniref:Pyruvate dehydrogenase E1 component subunit beta n=1 Tax=Escallonia herrerae TaxID=1293975 RepID=A0AA89BSP7_9ASTE|nr:hypothetical protein RJ639_000250 [Escallonia herrerae]